LYYLPYSEEVYMHKEVKGHRITSFKATSRNDEDDKHDKLNLFLLPSPPCSLEEAAAS